MKNNTSWLMALFLVPSVSAASTGDAIRPLSDLISSIFQALQPLAELIFGQSGDVSYLIGRILITLIILVIVYAIFSKIDMFKEKAWVLWVLSVAVSVLGVRFLSADLIKTIILPYSTLGIVLSAGIPFVVFFYIVNVSMKEMAPTIRRIAWIFFAVVFFVLYTSRYESLGEGQNVYPMFALLALIMAFLDGTINRFFKRVQHEKVMDERQYRTYLSVLKEYEKERKEMTEAKLQGLPPEAIKALHTNLGRLKQTLLEFREGKTSDNLSFSVPFRKKD